MPEQDGPMSRIIPIILATCLCASPLLAQTVHQVDIKTFAFVPATISAAVGDIIEWTNHDFAPHTATGDGWSTGELKYDATGRYIVSVAGVVVYHCAYHPHMTGTITVTEAK